MSTDWWQFTLPWAIQPEEQFITERKAGVSADVSNPAVQEVCKKLMGTRTNNQIQLDFFATVPSVSVYRILTFLRLVVVLSNTINTSLILAVFGQMLNNDPSTERCWPALSYVESHTSQNLWAFWVCFTCLTLPKLAVECTDSCSGFCEPPYSDGQCLGPLESLVLPGMYTEQRPPCPRTDDPVAVW